MPYHVLGYVQGTGAITFDPYTNAQTFGAAGNQIVNAGNNIVGFGRSGFVRLDVPVTSGQVYYEMQHGGTGNTFWHFGMMKVPNTASNCSFEPTNDGHVNSSIYSGNHSNPSGRIGIAVDYTAGTMRVFLSGSEITGGANSYYGPGSAYTDTIYPFIGNCNAGSGDGTVTFYWNEADFTVKSQHAVLSTYSSISGS